MKMNKRILPSSGEMYIKNEDKSDFSGRINFIVTGKSDNSDKSLHYY